MSQSSDNNKDAQTGEAGLESDASATEATSETMQDTLSGDDVEDAILEEVGDPEAADTRTDADTGADLEDKKTDGDDHAGENADENLETRTDEQSDRQDDRHRDDHHDDHHHDEHESHGSGFAATALKILLLVLAIFGLSLWAMPRIAPHLPAGIAKHLMPGQKDIDSRLAAMEETLAAGTQGAVGEVEALRTEIAALQERLATAEAEATAAREAAEAATTNATSAGASDGAVQEASEAANQAATAADTATSAATEAGKVASAAMRDTATLSRQMTSFEARLATLSEELGALGEALAQAPSGGGQGSNELSAAFGALKARVDGLADQLGTSGLITEEDAARFITQDDLRSARTALSTDLDTAIGALPEPGSIVTIRQLDEVKTEVGTALDGLTARVDAAETTAKDAKAASDTAVGSVETAIRTASLRASIATLTSQMNNGAPFAGAVQEIESLTGETAPEALSGPAATGVATPDELLTGFGRRAQDALAAEIRESSEGGVFGEAGARLRSVMAGRPKSEQEGDDTASILSRVEARLKEGTLDAALIEAEALPEAPKAALGDWLASLRTRVEADGAAKQYVSGLTGSEG